MSDHKPVRRDAEAGFVVPAPNGPPPPVLRKRKDFLACARARKVHAPGFTLQARPRGTSEAEGFRVGYTCSKKVGNAVQRNRAKRRLREVARTVIPADGREGWDYVLIGRPGITASRRFTSLVDDLRIALRKVHAIPSADNRIRRTGQDGKPRA